MRRKKSWNWDTNYIIAQSPARRVHAKSEREERRKSEIFKTFYIEAIGDLSTGNIFFHETFLAVPDFWLVYDFQLVIRR